MSTHHVDSEGRRWRIAYQSFGPASNEAYLDALRRQVASIGAAFDASVDVHTVPGARLGAKQHRSLQHLDTALLTRQVWRHAERGYDAVVVGNIQDPGVPESRQLVDIPVVGLLESTLTLAPAFGPRVCLVLTHRRIETTVREAARSAKLEDRIYAVTSLGCDLTGVSADFRSRTGPARDAVRTLITRVEEAIAVGADVVVPAAGLLGALVEEAATSPTAEGQELLRMREAGYLWCPTRASVAYATATAMLRSGGQRLSRRGGYERPAMAEVEHYFAQLDRLSGDLDASIEQEP